MDRKDEMSARILSSTFDALQDMVVVIDRDLRVVMSNWKGHDYISPEERQGQPYCYRVFMRREVPCQPCHVLDVFASGQARATEKTNPIDGSTNEIRALPILDAHGDVVLVVEHVRDITERKRAEEEARGSEERYRSVVDNIGIGICVVSPAMEVLALNKRLRERYPGVDVSTKPLCYRVFHDPPEERECPDCQVLRTLEDGAVHESIWEALRGKETRSLRIVSSPVKDKAGKVTAVIEMVEDVTDRRRAEEALRTKSDLLARIMETSPVGVVLVNHRGEITFANSQAEKVLGLGKDKITQRVYNAPDWHISDYDGHPFPEEGLPFRQVMRTGRPVWDVRHAVAWPDGRRVLLSVNGAPLFDELGRLGGVVASLIDVTEAVRAADEIRSSETRYRELFDSMTSGVAVYEARDDGGDFVFRDFNRASERIEKIAKADVLGRSVLEVFPAVRDFGLFDVLQRVWRTGNPERFPLRMYQDERITGWRENYVYRLPSGDVVAVYDDVSERKLAEETLRHSEERYRQLVESLQEGIWALDTESRTTFVNPRMAEMLGYTADEMQGREVFSFMDETNREICRDHLDRLKEGGGQHQHVDFVRKDGTCLHTRVQSSSITGGDGTFVGVLCAVSDVGERKRAEEEARQSREQLRRLAVHVESVREEERSRIAREIHDDLGQALTALKIDVRWLGSRLRKDQKLLVEKTRSMSDLIDTTVQSVHRICADLRPGLLDELGLSAAMEWQANAFRERTGISCEVMSEPEEIVLDRERSTAVFRIFQETLTNVARHAQASGVRATLHRNPEELELRVSDNGRGIAEQDIPGARSFGIIGMRERARSLGGIVEIKGAPNKGTTVTVRIPLTRRD